jgi:replicative DNA helicase
MKESKLSGALQENIITLAVFDKKAIPLLMNSVDVDLFSTSIYRDIAGAAFEYYRQFKKPAKNHISDLLESVLTDKSSTEAKSKAQLYKDTLLNIYDSKDEINREYVLNGLANFVEEQQLIQGVKKAAQLLKSSKVDEAKLVMHTCHKKQLTIFDSGLKLYDHKGMLACLDTSGKTFPIGMSALENYDIGPARGQLLTFAALSNKGKSWFGVHLARYALKHRLKVLHVSLEMSKEEVGKRYLQSLFAVSKRNEMVRVPVFEEDEYGNFCDLDFKNVKPKLTFDQKDIKKKLSGKLKKLKKPQLVIKQFPNGMLTVNKLRAYLENLIHYDGFLPDIIFLDYPRCMKVNVDNLTGSLGQIYQDLRGIAVEYNIAMVIVSQINRAGESVKWLTAKYLAEDFSQYFTSDVLITYNQTSAEYEHNLARLLVVKSRGDKKDQKVLISQNYTLGQFCIDSVLMTNGIYDDILNGGFDDDEPD